MPVTRSSSAIGAAATFQSSFHTNFLHAQKENVLVGSEQKQRDRVVANPAQVVALKALHQVSLSRFLTKDDIVKVASETGLKEKWIRKWLTRKRHPRGKAKMQEVLANVLRENGAQDHREQGKVTVCAGHRNTSPASGSNNSSQNLDVSFLNLLTDASSISASCAAPDFSGTLPAPPLTTASPVLPRASMAIPSVGNDYFSVFARSPTLGYIPSVFPTTSAETQSESPSLTPSTDSGYGADTVPLPLPLPLPPSASQGQVPTVPTFNYHREITHDPNSSAGAPSMDSLLRLLQDVTEAQTQQDHVEEGFSLTQVPQSAYTAAHASQHSSTLSFFPSLRPHSSVMHASHVRPSLSQHTSRYTQPMPVSYKTRLSGLSGLSGLSFRRIRAASSEFALGGSQLAYPDEDPSGSCSSAQSTTGEESITGDVQGETKDAVTPSSAIEEA